ncbi:MAG: multiheme c-type cytochrome [Terriglobales bacterium]
MSDQNTATKIGRKWRRLSWLALAIIMSPCLMIFSVSLYYERSGGSACATCHEIWQPYSDWHSSAHRNVKCQDCHGNVFTLEAGFHVNNMRRVITHLRGRAPDSPKLRTNDVLRMVTRCAKCHQEEFASWSASAHSATYRQLFLNSEHNHRQVPMDDCLRCHGMHFQGPMRDLVTPLNTTGPWRLLKSELAAEPAIPCLTCHQIHHEGLPLEKPPAGQELPSAHQEINRPSLGLFDRREQRHVPVAELPLPRVYEGERAVKISPDQRQALCYQCHAPLAMAQVRSGDDRTPIGVHEGLSCLACHLKHGQQTRASCRTCHPQLSNCGIDVETMDTTFKDKTSRHNIHSVKCADCHPSGIPKRKNKERTERVALRGEATAQIELTGKITRQHP